MGHTPIFAIIMVAVYMMYETNQRTFTKGESRTDIQQSARIALEDIITNARMAGYLTGSPSSTEAVRIATSDTLSIYGDFEGSGNRYVTYSLRDGSGVLSTTLRKERATDDWSGGDPLAENVTRLVFTYYDASGQTLPTDPLPAPQSVACPSAFPIASNYQDSSNPTKRLVYQLDAQGFVTGSNQPSAVSPGSERDRVRKVRVEITVESNIQLDSTSGCFKRNVGGETQSYTVSSEAILRNLTL